ncbi:MAG TPA: conjugative coupling factor TraD, PFGI-1 class, partial [Steroidobacteraceae bacterium]|nr:conjugative coupling factor TraD, PFGI-1 class [Steroidobacteraceae bacterium]
PKVEVATAALVSGATDSSDPSGPTAFVSNTQDRITTTSVPLIEPAHVVALPKGQAFALTEGGVLWKVRIPLPKPDADEILPEDLKRLAASMRERYADTEASIGGWWKGTGAPDPNDTKLPNILTEGTGDSGAPAQRSDG